MNDQCFFPASLSEIVLSSRGMKEDLLYSLRVFFFFFLIIVVPVVDTNWKDFKIELRGY